MENAMVPELAVLDWQRTRQFYCDILGFRSIYDRPEDGFSYLTLGPAALMIDQIGWGRTFDSGHAPDAYPFGRGVNLQITVPDVAALLAALDAANWPLFLPLEDRWYRRDRAEVGIRQFIVADPDGYLLRFAQDLGTRPIPAPACSADQTR